MPNYIYLSALIILFFYAHEKLWKKNRMACRLKQSSIHQNIEQKSVIVYYLLLHVEIHFNCRALNHQKPS